MQIPLIKGIATDAPEEAPLMATCREGRGSPGPRSSGPFYTYPASSSLIRSVPPHFIRLLYVPLFAPDSRLESESLQRSRRGRAGGLWTGSFFRILKGLSIIRIVQPGAGVHQQRGRGGGGGRGGGPRHVDVRTRLIALWHQSLRREKSHGGTWMTEV